MYTSGVLTSLKNGRLIAQSHIIPRFRVTKPHRGGLYQLEARASAREKGAMRDIAHTRESKHCTREEGRRREFAPVVRSEAVMPALVHLVVTSVKCYG